jgi:hypothetical protein
MLGIEELEINLSPTAQKIVFEKLKSHIHDSDLMTQVIITRSRLLWILPATAHSEGPLGSVPIPLAALPNNSWIHTEALPNARNCLVS